MATCPFCKTRYSGGALLCRNCGRPVPAADIAEEAGIAEAAIAELALGPGDPTPNVAANALRICPRCGRVVPTRHKACSVCRDDPSAPVEVVRRVDDAYWGHVAFAWACAGCSSRVPLASLADDGRAVCPTCGHTQELSALLWRTALRHAHAVADMAGPDPEGGAVGRPPIAPLNPFKEVGIERADAPGERLRPDDDTPANLVAGPGHPICACGALVEPRWRGGGYTCTCGVSHSGEMPALVRRAMPRGVVALLVDRDRPRAPRGAAVIALECPRCHAPLDAPEGVRRVTCKYCGGSAAIVDPAVPPPSPSPSPVPRLWVLFRGPSGARTDLEARAGR
ncbi:zinc ribbon domain-containing protein [Sorangium sp. So ce448]|uniref:double zinc ribbon domain-containing protein n=1 Tax=Sorangium sp. So ce448 TaxID=3133314 RepID=UPI003F63A215